MVLRITALLVIPCRKASLLLVIATMHYLVLARKEKYLDKQQHPLLFREFTTVRPKNINSCNVPCVMIDIQVSKDMDGIT